MKTIHNDMNSIHIEQILGSRARVGVLRVLSRVEVPLSIRQVARQAGMTHAVVAEALGQLVELGIVATTEAGRSRVHWLERRNVITREVVHPVFEAEERLFDTTLDEIRSCLPEGLFSSMLFGSRARGEARPSSDFDVLVVERDTATLEAAMRAIDSRSGEMRARLGAYLSVLGRTVEQALDLLERGDNFMEGVARDGIVLAGVGVEGWHGGAQGVSD